MLRRFVCTGANVDSYTMDQKFRGLRLLYAESLWLISPFIIDTACTIRFWRESYSPMWTQEIQPLCRIDIRSAGRSLWSLRTGPAKLNENTMDRSCAKSMYSLSMRCSFLTEVLPLEFQSPCILSAGMTRSARAGRKKRSLRLRAILIAKHLLRIWGCDPSRLFAFLSCIMQDGNAFFARLRRTVRCDFFCVCSDNWLKIW